MRLGYNQTIFLIDRVLESHLNEASEVLRKELSKMRLTIQSFYDGTIHHGPYLNCYTSDQWLDFHLKVPHWRLRAEEGLMKKLSPKHREILEGLS